MWKNHRIQTNERKSSLCKQIVHEWACGSPPSALLSTSGADDAELLKYVEGRTVNELPFDDPYFCTLTPLYYFTEAARDYYIAGYMLDVLSRALRAESNPWLGMDIPVVHCLDVLAKISPADNLAAGQKRCIGKFLELVVCYSEFYFCKNAQELAGSALKWVAASAAEKS